MKQTYDEFLAAIRNLVTEAERLRGVLSNTRAANRNLAASADAAGWNGQLDQGMAAISGAIARIPKPIVDAAPRLELVSGDVDGYEYLANVVSVVQTATNAALASISSAELHQAGITPETLRQQREALFTLGQQMATVALAIPGNVDPDSSGSIAKKLQELGDERFDNQKVVDRLLTRRLPILANGMQQMLTGGTHGLRIGGKYSVGSYALGQVADSLAKLRTIPQVTIPDWVEPPVTDVDADEYGFRASVAALEPEVVAKALAFAAETYDLLPENSEREVLRAATEALNENGIALTQVAARAGQVLGLPPDTVSMYRDVDVLVEAGTRAELLLTRPESQAGPPQGQPEPSPLQGVRRPI